MSKLQRRSTHVGDPRPRVFSSFGAVLAIASVLATVALPVLFWGILPGLHKRYFVHLDHVQARLAFPIRFALERQVAWAVVLVGLGLTLSGLVVRFALRARRSGRALLTLAVLQAALAIGLIGLGVRQADETCAFAPTKDLRRCGCPPELIESPLECHCDGAGSVREILWPRRVMEGSIIGDRLFYGSRPAPNRDDDVTVVRETLWIDSDNRLLERTFSVDGTEGAVRCKHGPPCAASQVNDCGPCTFDEEPPPVYEIRADLRCVDVRRGSRRVSNGDSLHLRRSVWKDPTEGTLLPASFDPAAALPTTTPEIVGVSTISDPKGNQTLQDIVHGGNRAPPMRRGGVRECRTRAGLAGILAQGFDEVLADTASIVVRIEVVE